MPDEGNQLTVIDQQFKFTISTLFSTKDLTFSLYSIQVGQL